VSKGESFSNGEYREIESGRKLDRQQVTEAMRMCRMTNSTLQIAKLDRLVLDTHFLLDLEKSAIKFVAADMPFASRLKIGVMVLIGEEEA
jgi:DNA invertase Pin-like site-specific DNA recombinase